MNKRCVSCEGKTCVTPYCCYAFRFTWTHSMTHTHTHIREDSCGQGISISQKLLYKNKWQSKQTDIHPSGEIRTRISSKRAASHTHPSPGDHWDRQDDKSNGHRAVRYNEMRQMWLGWRRLISKNFITLQCIVIYSVECAWEFLHFVQTVYRTVTVHYTNTQTNNLPPQTARSLSQLPMALEESWTYLLTCCVQQFTADCWPLLCCDPEG